MREINKAHLFGSGNKRSAYFSANEFICKNKGYWTAKKRDKQKEICIKIREGRKKMKTENEGMDRCMIYNTKMQEKCIVYLT